MPVKKAGFFELEIRVTVVIISRSDKKRLMGFMSTWYTTNVRKEKNTQTGTHVNKMGYSLQATIQASALVLPLGPSLRQMYRLGGREGQQHTFSMGGCSLSTKTYRWRKTMSPFCWNHAHDSVRIERHRFFDIAMASSFKNFKLAYTFRDWSIPVVSLETVDLPKYLKLEYDCCLLSDEYTFYSATKWPEGHGDVRGLATPGHLGAIGKHNSSFTGHATKCNMDMNRDDVWHCW